MQIPGKLIKLQQWIDEGSQTVIQFWPLIKKSINHQNMFNMILTLKMSLRNLVPLGIDNHPQIISQSLTQKLLKIKSIFNI